MNKELIEYWRTYCKNSDSKISLCYWKYFCSEIQDILTEDFIAEWENSQEYRDYFSDWEEYTNEV